MPPSATAIPAPAHTRAEFDDLVYMSWKDAVEEIKKRQNDPALDAYIAKLLPQGVPSVMEGKESMVLFRHVATPNYEIMRFFMTADSLDHLQPLVLEYTGDRFTNRNEWKFSLAKLCFYKGLNKKAEPLFEAKTIIDVNAANNKPISEVLTLWGERLVDFHHHLFAAHLPQFAGSIFDLSSWLKGHGPTARDYYKPFFALFLKHGILFENFLVDSKEAQFTEEVILPALRSIQEETGYKPLIVALEPTEMEADAFWLSHPFERKQGVDKRAEG